jgi:hypothetical protein
MKITVKQFREEQGLIDPDAFTTYLTHLVMDSVCPAMCDEGCEVEPDGRCEHGNPSLLIKLGMI